MAVGIPVTAVDVAVAAGWVSTPPGVTIRGVGEYSTGGKVGGIEVSVGVAWNIAVWVRLGVGKVNGVGEEAPGSVQDAPTNVSKARISTERLWLYMTSSNSLLRGYSVQILYHKR